MGGAGCPILAVRGWVLGLPGVCLGFAYPLFRNKGWVGSSALVRAAGAQGPFLFSGFPYLGLGLSSFCPGVDDATR